MLEIRPTCEQCNKSLPPQSQEAMICSFECTFCKDCVDTHLLDVCPNCLGSFVPRPIRPLVELKKFNATEKVVFKPINPTEHQARYGHLQNVPVWERDWD